LDFIADIKLLAVILNSKIAKSANDFYFQSNLNNSCEDNSKIIIMDLIDALMGS